jgi:hypothetical protein
MRGRADLGVGILGAVQLLGSQVQSTFSFLAAQFAKA